MLPFLLFYIANYCLRALAHVFAKNRTPCTTKMTIRNCGFFAYNNNDNDNNITRTSVYRLHYIDSILIPEHNRFDVFSLRDGDRSSWIIIRICIGLYTRAHYLQPCRYRSDRNTRAAITRKLKRDYRIRVLLLLLFSKKYAISRTNREVYERVPPYAFLMARSYGSS